MSKKTLLEEGSVRHFMKLANLKPLAEEFVTEMYKDKDDEEKMEEQEVNEEEETVTEGEGEEAVTEGEENLEESSCGEKNEEAVNEETEEVTEGEEETVAEEMEDELGDMGEPEEAAGEMDKEDMLRDVVSAVAKVLDVDVNFGGEGEADAEMAMDAGEEAADLEMADDMADELDDAPAMRQYDEEFDLEAVVAEVTKRVKERLLDTKE